MSRSKTVPRARSRSRRKAKPGKAPAGQALTGQPITDLLKVPDPAAGTGPRFPEGKASVDLSSHPPAVEGGPAFQRKGPSEARATAPVSVRTVASADAPAVAALWSELNRLHEPLGEEWAVADGAAERYARSVSAAAGNPRAIHLVAEMELDGAWRVVGFIHAAVKLRSSVYKESVVGEIPAICVAADAVGRGVGSALVAAAMEWFRHRGIARVETIAAHQNGPARGFWRAAGFRDSAVVYWAEVPAGAGAAAGPAEAASAESGGAEDVGS